MPELKTVHLEKFIDLNKESLNLKLSSHLSLQEPAEPCWARIPSGPRVPTAMRAQL